MADLGFCSADKRYGLWLADAAWTGILQLCTEARDHETGGILIGRYSAELDCAMVTSVSGAPHDSRAGRTWFQRGVRGLKRLLEQAWTNEESHYIGEWHFHPGGQPAPSGTDRQQLEEIARSPIFRCPEPILLIVGGRPPEAWEVSAHVFPRGCRTIELTRAPAGGLTASAC